MGFTVNVENHIAEVVMDHPPVNALTVAGWFELADLVTAAGRDPRSGRVVLRAEGKGFNAGVDIKEMQATEGFDALLGANRGCYAAFAAVYDCEVPVIAAVHGFCLGGGIGLVGNADVIVAAEGTDVRSARGQPGRAGRRDPPGPPRAAPPDAGDGVHRPIRSTRRCSSRGDRSVGVVPTVRAPGRRVRGRREDLLPRADS